ncbi:hypothetical protein EIP86_000151 [Pleurotus ostreatoroseus]|nr:hypothetical protein EIP86_000151 [Pleurotus ostreatoroseus]
MFCKDPITPTFAQGTLRAMAMLEPGLIMPEILERAYGGLEVINETHRTTAVLTALAGVALPLTSEKLWVGGQKHIMPLLELCIPGIDLNDPMKTLCASMFIVSVLQHIKISDLSIQQGGVPLSGAPAEEMMEIDGYNGSPLPSGTGETPILSKEEERALARDSTANFSDWLVSLFRRVFALYENLPEEGGKKNTTGGKMEEAVLKSIKGTLDILCLQLSEPFFDLVLRLVFDYATTNAKSNAVRAFGQLVGCLARVKPDKTIALFLPYCMDQIKEELKHGASSVRTTSSGTALPSDTTLHWNMSILRGCLGYGGPSYLRLKRHLHHIRCMWSGLPTIYREQDKVADKPHLYEDLELDELLVKPLAVKAGFVLEDPSDPRYQKVLAHRTRFGQVIHRAAVSLRQPQEGEDHIDAVISVSKAIDVYLLGYAMTRTEFDALQKTYSVTRDINRMWPRQKENSRQVFLKRAQAYHSGRVYLQSLYRRRTALDDSLLEDLVELSLSRYTRVRRHSQAILHNVCGYYVRSMRHCLPYLLQALSKGADPDRMKGALYVLWNKGIASYAAADPQFHGQYLRTILECQHQEKPSVQKLVGSVAEDTLSYLTEEAVHTNIFVEDVPDLVMALDDLATEFSPATVNAQLLVEASNMARKLGEAKRQRHQEAITKILEIASRPTTHWRYIQIACQFLKNLIVRDLVPPAQLASFLMKNAISPHTTIRTAAHKLKSIIRSYARTADDMWRHEWRSPLCAELPIDPANVLNTLWQPPSSEGEVFYVDKLDSGFLTWAPTIKAYRKVEAGASALTWEEASQPLLEAMRGVISQDDFFKQLAALFAQESAKNPSVLKIRAEHVVFVKSIAKTFESERLQAMLSAIEPLLTDPDRYKQRAGAEMLCGILRGSKHWPRQHYEALWTWTMSQIEVIYSQLKPDTLPFWEEVIHEQFTQRDPRRAEPLVQWIMKLPLDFQGDSAFAMTSTLSLFNNVVDGCSPYFGPKADQYMNLFLVNANTGYAEVRSYVAQILATIIDEQWRPVYPSCDALLTACREKKDPFGLREARHLNSISQIASQFPVWKQERLPPPRVSQSQYDKIGLTMLQWIWAAFHGPHASLVLPYALVLMPEILRMSELNDSSELQKYSSAVLYVFSAVNAPQDEIDIILGHFLNAIQSSDVSSVLRLPVTLILTESLQSWRVRLNALPTLLVFFYRNLMNLPSGVVLRMMDVLLDCLADENVEVREMASQMLSGVVRCSQRQSIIPLRDRFIQLARKTKLPPRRDPNYAQSIRILHSAILGLCALIDSFPYSVEHWMPPLTEVLAIHATDPAPISTTIRKCASDFKKDTWHKDQLAFDEDQLQNLSTMLVGTSYYA